MPTKQHKTACLTLRIFLNALNKKQHTPTQGKATIERPKIILNDPKGINFANTAALARTKFAILMIHKSKNCFCFLNAYLYIYSLINQKR